ncbi:phage head morphogenesis protein, SPP1 gp7 family [Candidatus Ornithobacterium hominis]|uniref:phage minor head protein n=1 Tax=Candidatus Ornithobacterium hominis TaxID=2497989 RepID=UPI000E8FFB23|nr:phage minor head protein [Candidatus Ornithobacterium hominis]SZD73666.1 phage head morphogenesis protein, SPP1 gp7 family [Candidatus Ornithobacterium hominis]
MNEVEQSILKLSKERDLYFTAAVDVGYNPTFEFYSKELAANLYANIAQFSAFKARSFEKSLTEALWHKGDFISWNEFKKVGASINQDYNKNWLKTEYHQTVATANMAGKWQDIERTKDLYPNLKYVTVGDERVRAQHREWDGIVLPIEHPWWKIHYPPNDWGCRCDVERTDDPVSSHIPNGQLKVEFKNNAAQSGKVFEKSAYELGLTHSEKGEALGQLVFNPLGKTDTETLKEIYELPRETQFLEIYKNKGRVLKHLLVKEIDDYQEILEVSKAFALEKNTIEILPVITQKELEGYRLKIFPKYQLFNNPDLRVNNIYYDVKRPSAIKNILKRANEASMKQNSIAVIHCGYLSNFNIETMKKRAKDVFKSPHYQFDEVQFYWKGKLYKFNRQNK